MRVNHMGAFVIMEKASAAGMMMNPAMKITNTAGPSPASSISKFSPQAWQAGANFRKPLKTDPSPHL